ncbi:unnamed protein product [Chilo suppressalis]|uniref:Major facilitator superfamily (MFS) profile domain-containing protein n=1 Tax=Chilo suppressalis TaxID=168631 RepID=A0ABN8AZC2_CHISP|nr:unnamed protein product [Chilo suppressalis]
MIEKKKKHIRESNSEEDDLLGVNAPTIEYDTFLTAAGDFGLYQCMMFFCVGPFYIFGAFVYFSQLFMTEVSPNHWCWIPELQNLSEFERRSLAIPDDLNSRFGYSHCQAYVANWSEVLENGLNPNSSWPISSCQNGWEFNKTEIPYPTISSELGWVCDGRSNQAKAQSIFFIGSIIGGFLIGLFADRYGRLSAATLSNIIGCSAGVGSIYARNFTEFAICRFFVGCSYDNCLMMTYLLILETTSPKYRTVMANLSFAVFYTTGVTSLPWIALACGHWKTLCLATSIPLASALLAHFILPESPTWLLSKGRVDETVKKIMTIAKVNKKEISPKMVMQFKLTVAQQTDPEKASLIDLLRRPILRKLFIISCIQFVCSMLIFDLSTRTINQLKYDFFLSFTFISLTEFPSLVLISFILDPVGRRWLTIVVMLICAVFSILTPLIPNSIASVVCAVISRFTINMTANTATQWVAEVLPTAVRGSGAATVHICAYMASVISPFIAHLDSIAYWLPFAFISCIASLCAILAFLLPETANKEMPQTFEAAETLMREKDLWFFPWNKNNESKSVNDIFEMN